MLDPLELGALGFAAYRGTQLLVWDTLLDRPRIWLRVRLARNPGKLVWWFPAAVVACIYCAGMYVSGVALLVYLLATGGWGGSPWIVHGIEWFVVAGVQALLNRWDDSLPGHNPDGGNQ